MPISAPSRAERGQGVRAGHESAGHEAAVHGVRAEPGERIVMSPVDQRLHRRGG